MGKIISIVFAALITITYAAAEHGKDGSISTSRYLAQKDQISVVQKSPLQAPATMSFPRSVKTVGDAMLFTLQVSGYGIEKNSRSAFVLFNHPLPEIQREIGPLSIINILKTLAGVAFTVEVNELWRKVVIRSVETIPEEALANAESEWNKRHSPAFEEDKKNFHDYELKNETYRVKDGDFLSSIANKLGIKHSDLDSWMIAVVASNPSAFVGHDVNMLLAGSVLQLPKIKG